MLFIIKLCISVLEVFPFKVSFSEINIILASIVDLLNHRENGLCY